jgi:hypothetical protein
VFKEVLESLKEKPGLDMWFDGENKSFSAEFTQHYTLVQRMLSFSTELQNNIIFRLSPF